MSIIHYNTFYNWITRSLLRPERSEGPVTRLQQAFGGQSNWITIELRRQPNYVPSSARDQLPAFSKLSADKAIELQSVMQLFLPPVSHNLTEKTIHL